MNITDCIRDIDSEMAGCDVGVEYEPVSETDDDGILSGDSSGDSNNDIIYTQVLSVSVRDDGDLSLADAEQTDTELDSEMDWHDYWQCAQCNKPNNNPTYRYCEKCFKERKNFFPPRPKRKHKSDAPVSACVPRTLSQDSGVESAHSQELPHGNDPFPPLPGEPRPPSSLSFKRRAESVPFNPKRAKHDSDSEIDSDSVTPLVKTTSDPALTIESEPLKLTKKAIVNTIKEKLEPKNDMCIVCCTEPKSGVFVHGRIAHICCCYKCAVKVWAKVKRCPVCNCKVSNVLKAVVM